MADTLEARGLAMKAWSYLPCGTHQKDVYKHADVSCLLMKGHARLTNVHRLQKKSDPQAFIYSY